MIDSWGYALQTNDAAAVTALSPSAARARAARSSTPELAERRKEGWYVDFPGARSTGRRSPRAVEPGSGSPRATVDIPASASYFDDGTFRNDNEAHKGATFEVRMRLGRAAATSLLASGRSR